MRKDVHRSMRRLIQIGCLGLLAIAPGCAHEPAIRMALPESIASDGKAIAIIGDLQQTSAMARFVRRRENNEAEQQRLLADLHAQIDDLSALIVVGDLVFNARSSRQWAHFDSLAAPIAARIPVLPAIGNHDYPCWFVELCRTTVIARGMGERFPWFEPGKPYAVESGDLALLFLDSETGFEAQGEWLAAQLQAAPGQYAAALVFFHHPAYSNSIDRGAEGNTDVLAHFVPHLRAAGLPVVAFAGHIHGFEYIVRDGVHYVTTAGGGGPRGPMGEDRADDFYDGPSCRRERDGALLRPFNYALLQREADSIRIDVRGFCRADPEVRLLTTIEIPLD